MWLSRRQWKVRNLAVKYVALEFYVCVSILPDAYPSDLSNFHEIPDLKNHFSRPENSANEPHLEEVFTAPTDPVVAENNQQHEVGMNYTTVNLVSSRGTHLRIFRIFLSCCFSVTRNIKLRERSNKSRNNSSKISNTVRVFVAVAAWTSLRGMSLRAGERPQWLPRFPSPSTMRPTTWWCVRDRMQVRRPHCCCWLCCDVLCRVV